MADALLAAFLNRRFTGPIGRNTESSGTLVFKGEGWERQNLRERGMEEAHNY
jgi:hypothetical protein